MENAEILRTAPAVFAVGDTYQIMVPVSDPSLMWVQVGEEAYYDDSNGILRSAESTHRMTVPMEELNREKKYTVCYRKIIERKPYFTETEEELLPCFPEAGDRIYQKDHRKCRKGISGRGCCLPGGHRAQSVYQKA